MKPIIDQGFWAIPAVEASPAHVKLAALWLVTNSRTSLLGICGASAQRFAFETGLPAEALEETLQTLPMLFQRFEQGIIFLRTHVREQYGVGEALRRNNFIALKKHFHALTDPALKAAVVAEYPEFEQALPRAYQGLTKPKISKVPESTEQEGDEPTGQPSSAGASSSSTRRAAPPKPARDESHTYGRELGMAAAEVDAWYDHFESNGWRVSGKAPMKDWQAALRNWQRRAPDFKPRNGHSHGHGPGHGASPGASPPVASPSLPDHLATEWPAWLRSKGQPVVSYQYAPDFLKSDFHRERRGRAGGAAG